MAATPLAVNDVIRVTYVQDLFQQRLLTVLHFRVKTAPTGTYNSQMQNLATRLATTILFPVANWLDVIGAELTILTCRAQRVFPSPDIYWEEPVVAEGTHADPVTMPNAAISISKRTSKFGPHGIGRVQMGGVPASQIEDGLFNPTYVTAVEAAWETLLADLAVTADSGVYKLCLWDGDSVTSDDDVIQMIAKNDVRTMHRRTLRVGI